MRFHNRRPSGGRLRVLVAACVTLALATALAAVGGLGYAASAARSAVDSVGRIARPHHVQVIRHSPAADQYGGKVTICHRTHSKKNPWVTITVSQNAVPAHVNRHRDTIGACPPH